jgi:hypothetical protein
MNDSNYCEMCPSCYRPCRKWCVSGPGGPIDRVTQDKIPGRPHHGQDLLACVAVACDGGAGGCRLEFHAKERLVVVVVVVVVVFIVNIIIIHL